MAFDPTISAQLDKALRKLTEIERQVGGAQIRAAKNSATAAVSMLHNIRFDSGTQQLIRNMLTYKGVRVPDAPRRFLAEFTRSIARAARDLQAVGSMMREIENRNERIAARDAGVSEKEFFMARKIQKIKQSASVQMSLNDDLITEAGLQKRRIAARARTAQRAMEQQRADILTNSRGEITGIRSQLRSGSRPLTADEITSLQNERTDLGAMAARDKKGKTRAERAAIDARLAAEQARIDAKLTSNKKDFTAAEMKALRLRMQTLQNEANAQRKMLKERIEASKAATKSERSAIDAQIRALQEANAEIDVATRNLDNLLGQHRMANAQEFLLNMKDKLPGMGLVKSWQQSGSAIATTILSNGKLIGKMIGIGMMGFILFAIKALFDSTIDTLKAFRDLGFTGNQAKSQIGAARNDQFALAKRGVMASSEQIAETRAALANQLGQLDLPENLTREAQIMVTHFKMGAEAAAALSAQVYRISGRSDKAATSVFEMAKGFAIGPNGVSPAKLLQSMAENMEELARGGVKTADAFIRANVQAIKMGVSLGKVMDIANKFSTDFEGFLEAQASLNVFAPGVDLSALGNASVFGSEEDVLGALKDAVGGLSGFQDMTRSQQNLIARSIGLSVGDISNMLTDPKGRTLQQKSYDTQEALATSVTDALTGENSIPALLKQIISIITTGIGGFFFGKPGKSISESANAIPPQLAIAGRKHSGGYIDTNLSPRYHKGLMPKEVPAILLQGEAVLTPQMLSGLARVMTSVTSLGQLGKVANARLSGGVSMYQKNISMSAFDGPAIVGTDTQLDPMAARLNQRVNTQVDNSVQNPMTVVSMKNIESLLQELITATKDGKVIHMDGRKVGETITSAFSRG